MLRLGVGGALLFGIAAACSDPVSNPTQNQASALSQDVLADRSDDRSDSDNDRDRPRRSDEESGIDVYDDCDPKDPGWAPTGGCTLQGGKVSLEEFNLLLASPLSASVVGHPAWRNEPSYLRVGLGEVVPVENEGGRFHTFTRVARFGRRPCASLKSGTDHGP